MRMDKKTTIYRQARQAVETLIFQNDRLPPSERITLFDGGGRKVEVDILRGTSLSCIGLHFNF